MAATSDHASQITLELTEEGHERRFFPVGDEVTIGRSKRNSITVHAKSVSAHHARIFPSPEGLRVEDLGSTNKTKVNGDEIRSKLLANGDVITLGSAVRVQVLIPPVPGSTFRSSRSRLASPSWTNPSTTNPSRTNPSLDRPPKAGHENAGLVKDHVQPLRGTVTGRSQAQSNAAKAAAPISPINSGKTSSLRVCLLLANLLGLVGLIGVLYVVHERPELLGSLRPRSTTATPVASPPISSSTLVAKPDLSAQQEWLDQATSDQSTDFRKAMYYLDVDRPLEAWNLLSTLWDQDREQPVVEAWVQRASWLVEREALETLVQADRDFASLRYELVRVRCRRVLALTRGEGPLAERARSSLDQLPIAVSQKRSSDDG